MTKNHKIRLAFFLGIVLFLLICSADYAMGFRDLVYSEDLLFDSPEHMYVDGADVAGIFQLLTAGANSFVLAFTIFFYALFVIVGNIIFFLILRFAAIKKASEVSEAEYRISLRGMLIFTAVVFLVSVIITGFGLALYTLSLFWQTPLFAFLIYLLPLRKRIK